MWSHVVVLSEPLVDDDLSLLCCGEPLGIEHLVAKGTIEAFVVSVLPWRPRFYVSGLRTNCLDPLSNRIGDELRSVVREDVSRNATDDEQVGQGIGHVDSPEPPRRADLDALAVELVDDIGER